MSREGELKVLVNSLERLLALPFPAHDGWSSGIVRWENDRRKAIDALITEVKSQPVEQPIQPDK